MSLFCRCFSPNSVSTLWGSYGSGKEWCPSRCPSAAPRFDCAGSHRVPFVTTVCSRSPVAGFWVVLPGVRVLFGAKRGFTWQVQEIGWFWRMETWVYVAGARNRTRCENRGRRSILWTLPKRWQACVIRRIAFYVTGAGNPHHWCYVLRSKGSIPEKGYIFETWTWGAVCVASAAFRMTSGHDFVAGAVLLKHASIFVEVSHKTLILERQSFSFRGSLAQNARFGAPDLQFSRKSRTKRSFWKSGSSVFEEVSHKALVLEVWIFIFRGSLAQNARFGAPDLQVSKEISHKTLVLEVQSFSFRGSLAQNACFGSPDLQFSRKSRTKRSFWKSGSSIFEEVSHKTLVLELRIFNFRGSLAEFARLQYLDASGPKVDPNTEILRQRSCRSGPTGSW